MGAQREGGPVLFGSLGSSCWYKKFLFCLACSGQPSIKYFFPHRTLFQFFVSPSPSNLGRQSCRAACLWMCVSGLNISPSKALLAYTQTEPENDNLRFLSMRTSLSPNDHALSCRTIKAWTMFPHVNANHAVRHLQRSQKPKKAFWTG